MSAGAALADVLLNSASLQISTPASNRHSLQWRLQTRFFVWLCLKVRSDLVVPSMRVLLIPFLPVFRLYCMYSMNIKTTPDRKTKARLIPRGRQTCASLHKSLHFIYAVRFALLGTQPQYTKHYIVETQLIIVIAACLEATDVWKRQTTEDKRRNWGCFWQVLSRRWAKAVQGNQWWPLSCELWAAKKLVEC